MKVVGFVFCVLAVALVHVQPPGLPFTPAAFLAFRCLALGWLCLNIPDVT